MGEPNRKKLVVPVVLMVKVIGAAAGLAACGDAAPPETCTTVDDGGTETPCDAGPPDGPII